MKNNIKTTTVLVLVCLFSGICSLVAQGTFQNLDFESATVSPSQSGQNVSATTALPGWSVYLGSDQQSQVLFNNATVGSAAVDLIGPNSPSFLSVIDGSYSVVLQSGTFGPGYASASIEQTGFIPLNSQSLELKASESQPYTFNVLFNGSLLNMVPLSSSAGYTLYGANIKAFAGQTGVLDISAPGQGSFIEFDDITFSTTAVPEPSPLILTGFGGLLFALNGWRARRQAN